MPVTVADLLGRSELALRLITGDPSAVVRWAHSVELTDPTPWLNGGELVLTTGLRLPRPVQAQRGYVERLVAAKVVGIGFGVGLGHAKVPVTLIKECEAQGLVLLEVPLPTPFLAIGQAVADGLAQEQNAAVRRTLEHQHRITRAALRAGITGIVATLAKAMQAEVVVADSHQMVLAAAPGDGAVLLERVLTELGPRARSAGPMGLSASGEDGHLMVQSLGVSGARQGLLAVATERPLLHPDQLLVTHAASLLSLELERPHELVEAHRELRSAVFGTLLDGELAPEVTHRPLRYFGFAPSDRLVVVLVDAKQPRLALAQRVARSLDALPYLLAAREEGVVVLIRAVDQDEALKALEAVDVALGVSGSTTVGGLAPALRAAAHAASNARSEHRRVAHFSQLRLPALFADDAVRDAVGHLAEDLLAPMADQPVLYESLEVFLGHNGVWETASRALGVHRHTLRHRIARVAELTGLDLESAQDRAALLLALLSRRL